MAEYINPYYPKKSKIIRTYFESSDRNLKTFDIKPIECEMPNFIPGQFCEVSIWGYGESPFGIATSPTERDFLRFTVNKTGYVTSKLHELPEGSYVGIRGPLGNGYPVEKFKGSNIVIVGGGFAFTTLRSLLVFMLHNRDDFKDITVLYGAREPDLFLYKDELKEWEKRDDLKLILTIDRPYEGWNKKVGLVPPVLEEVSPSPKDAYAVVCGPPIMIKFTLPVLFKLGFKPDRIYTSLEKRMKCGIGKCGRCNVGQKYICKDGPVFSFEELNNLPEDL